MPYIKLETNKKVQKEQKLLKKLSSKMSDEQGKSESYIMTSISTNEMTFGGANEAAAFLEVKSIGLTKKAAGKLSAVICDFISQELDISTDRIYINFVDVDGAWWGWDSTTF